MESLDLRYVTRKFQPIKLQAVRYVQVFKVLLSIFTGLKYASPNYIQLYLKQHSTNKFLTKRFAF